MNSPRLQLQQPGPGASRQASVLVAVLWCLALLSIVVIGVLHLSRTDLQIVKNFGDKVQAHYLALAGIEKAKALLYQEARQRSRSASSHSGGLYDSPDNFRDVPLGRGQFRVFRRAAEEEGGGIRYGVSDEESRLNVNCATLDQLGKLEGMTPDVAAAILDWRDEDNEVSPGGAEADHYTSLRPPYLPRNGPFQTIRELLMVRGVSPELLLGRDVHQTGQLEPPEAGEPTEPAQIDSAETGWAGVMTVDSSVENVNAAGQDRVNIQTADEQSLTRVRGITAEVAKAIIAYRGANRFESIAGLLEVPAVQNQNQSGPQSSRSSSGNAANASGPKVISETLLQEIADDLTAQSGQAQPGLINLNTASRDVLVCLPGVSRELAQAIIAYRQSSGFFPNIAGLLKVPGMNQNLFKQLAPLVTARSETFRILSEGRLPSSGARQRIQAIVHVGLQAVTTVSYREDDL